MSDQSPKRRTIRSFVRRTGRVTPSQERALHEFWGRYGVDFQEAPLNLEQIFGRKAERVLDIGFGNGESLVAAALDYPKMDFLGIEVHEPGAGHCLLAAHDADIHNLRIVVHDAMEVMHHQLENASLSRINLLFADPWPKKRHHKRRIVNPPFLNLAAAKLAIGGTLHIATDWENYAEHIDEVLGTRQDFRLDERREHHGDQPLDRHTTKFETRGLRRGHQIWDWRFIRQ